MHSSRGWLGLLPLPTWLFDSHISKCDSASMGYASIALEPPSIGESNPSDCSDSCFFVSRIGGANQMCEYDSRKRGEVGAAAFSERDRISPKHALDDVE